MRTAILIRTTMSVDAAKLLRLQSWFSPAFPIGAFSYSHGLEWAVEEGGVTDRGSLVAWLEADLRHGSGRTDAMFFAAAWRAAASLTNRPASSQPASGQPAEADILAVAELAAAMRGTAELALESGQQGIAFLGAVRKAWPHTELDRLAKLLMQVSVTPVLPVAAGICCAVHEIDMELALPLYVHGSAANLVNAAVRLVPLGQTDGQIALAAMEPAVLETAREAFDAPLADMGSAAFMIDLASMRHETQYTRLFRS